MHEDEPATIQERRLTIVGDELQAEMLRSLLEQHGISSVVRRTSYGEVQWGAINVGMGGPREVVVADRDLEQARLLLEDASPADVDAEPHDEQLVRRGTNLRLVWGMVALVLFGLPLLLWLAASLLRMFPG
jgi:hypothetical protein